MCKSAEDAACSPFAIPGLDIPGWPLITRRIFDRFQLNIVSNVISILDRPYLTGGLQVEHDCYGGYIFPSES